MSKKTAATWWLVERHSCQSLVMVRRASCVEDFGLKPYWQSDRTLFLRRKSITLLWIHLSSTFEIRERREMGQLFEASDLWIGVMLDHFHSSGMEHCLREKLNKAVKAGVIEQAVLRSITLEIPSGPDAVLTLCVESSL